MRSAGKQRVLPLKQIYRDTNIPKKYLEALEAEDFAQFRGRNLPLRFHEKLWGLPGT